MQIRAFIERYRDPSDPRVIGTIGAIRRRLSDGPLLHRYTTPDGIGGGSERSSRARSASWRRSLWQTVAARRPT